MVHLCRKSLPGLGLWETNIIHPCSCCISTLFEKKYLSEFKFSPWILPIFSVFGQSLHSLVLHLLVFLPEKNSKAFFFHPVFFLSSWVCLFCYFLQNILFEYFIYVFFSYSWYRVAVPFFLPAFFQAAETNFWEGKTCCSFAKTSWISANLH